MNRIVNLGAFPAIAAFVFFLIACSSHGTPQDSQEGNGQGQESSSSFSSNSSDTQNTSSSSVRSSSSAMPPVNFTETVGNASFDMVYIPGGTFTIGCEKSSGCPADAAPVPGVKVSNYFIGKTEVSTGLWNAVMGTTCTGYTCNAANSYTNMTWYDAMEFSCKLSQKTGKNYRMTTEAEWEYAAKNHLSSLEKVGTGEEWAYNSWSGTHSGGTDPVGTGSGSHTQKTRRDAQGTADNITGRLIRSIEGVGPALRLALSADASFPPNYVPPCNLHAPEMGDEPVNSYRDPRWVTGSDKKWTTGGTAIGSFDLRVWDDGTARLGSGYGSFMNYTNGQWFTSNNIAFVFVPSTGSITKYAYIFLDETQGSLISAGGFIGRIAKESADNITKPTISGGLKSGAELAAAAGDDYKMVDMVNIPESAKKQDARLIDGPGQGWFQDNSGPGIGGVHHYRKDIDADEFRFTVNQNNRTMLANGAWFTVNNTFLRVTHSTGYTADYLYAVGSDGTFYHNSFMGYERGDFRMFKKANNSTYNFPASCGSHCNEEIPKGLPASMYAPGGYMADVGHSTFVPAPCPLGGCK
ncbi:MAG: formylglycine-generating enzyme family protein [Fibromonadaceae bacterium]|jgi:hypothetical protein|nr:formylglycine-generating enzyme family protein [Fibromonadaceae bacterium]